MSNLQAILRYQETDQKLFKLEGELASCAARKEYVSAKKFLEAAAEKLDSLETKARSLKDRAAEMTQKCAAVEKDLEEFSGIDELIEEGADVSYYKKAAQKQLDALKKMKAELASIIEDAKTTDKDYKELKKEVIARQKTYATAKEEYSKAKEAREEERNALNAALEEIAKDIEESAMNKYKAKRKEKVFPVVMPIADGRCPSCMMEVPLAAINSLKDGVIECESCRRILYKA